VCDGVRGLLRADVSLRVRGTSAGVVVQDCGQVEADVQAQPATIS
jgi:hypothetical protein